MKKTSFIALTMALLLLFTLAACAGGGAPPSSTPAPPASEPAPPADAFEPAPVPDADPNAWILEEDTAMSGKVGFWIPFTGDQGMDAMIAEFNETYPNIEVVLNTYNNNAEGNVSVNTSIMAGEVDVLASFEIVNGYTRWSNGMYLDLTEKVAAEGIDLVENWGTDAYNYNDQVFVLPCGGISYYVAINKTAWDAAGLGEIPTAWTWDEYLAACEAMTVRDAAGATTTYGGGNYQVLTDILDVVYQVNGQNRYYNADGTSSFNSELALKAVARNVEAENGGIWFPTTTYRGDNNKAWFTFTDKSVSSTVIPNITRFLRDTEQYPVDFITTFAPYPTEEPAQTNHMSGVNYFSFAGIAKGCQDEAAAWAFLKWYSTYGSKYLVLAGHQSTWKQTNADDLVALTFGSEEEAAKLIDVEAYKRVVGVTGNPSSIDTMTDAYAELTGIWDEYVMYAYNGQMTVEDALNQAAQLANTAIEAA